MYTYKNISGKSGVSYYSTSTDSIVVRFNTGATYVYNHIRPGMAQVEKMKVLAATGKGLNSLINREIRENYYLRIK